MKTIIFSFAIILGGMQSVFAQGQTKKSLQEIFATHNASAASTMSEIESLSRQIATKAVSSMENVTEADVKNATYLRGNYRSLQVDIQAASDDSTIYVLDDPNGLQLEVTFHRGKNTLKAVHLSVGGKYWWQLCVTECGQIYNDQMVIAAGKLWLHDQIAGNLQPGAPQDMLVDLNRLRTAMQ